MTCWLRIPVIKKWFAHRLARHFARPGDGWIGSTALHIMRTRNTAFNDWILTHLDLQATDHVLEIGFGEGLALQRASTIVTAGTITGIDYSARACQLASAHHRAAIQAGRVRLYQGDIAAMPFEDDQFDKVWGVHVVYFWSDPVAVLREVRRVLKPGGRLVLGTQIKQGMLKSPFISGGNHIFHLYSNEELCALLSTAGFHDVHNAVTREVGFTVVMTSGIK